MLKLFLVALAVFCLRQNLFSQYILNGSAVQKACNCYTLTPATTTKSGSVWNANKINLTSSFDFWFNVYLGCNDGTGADGIVFILQPISTSVGTTGEGMGFSGVSPSVGIALDTWQNTNLSDPAYDHISIQTNGAVNHAGDLAGPVTISATSDNVEDCQWHKLRITWDASGKWLRTYFDGVLRLEKQIDLVPVIFNNNPAVYWGFTGATGGMVNLQQFCTALDPIFTTNFTANIACEGQPVVFNNTSESFAPITSYNWNFGDGTTSNLATPPPHVYAGPGDYRVTLKVKGQDGCERDSTKIIKVAANPSASLEVFDTCFKKQPRLAFASDTTGLTFQWQLDGISSSGSRPSGFDNLTAGDHRLQVVATSAYSCGVPAMSTANFTVYPLPVIEAQVQDGCVNELIDLESLQTDSITTIVQWNWRVESHVLSGQNQQYRFSQPAAYPMRLWAVADNGCNSDTVQKTINIATAFLMARDTTLIQNIPSQLSVQSNGNVVWSPAVGLSNAAITNPVATLSADQAYTITATTPEGCVAEATMAVKVFKGPTIYVPTAFTPNGDGRNEVLLPVYVGIKELKRFAVFNRWGQMVFATASMGKGWEGKTNTGTYIWLIEAVDYLGKRLVLKGTVTIIR